MTGVGEIIYCVLYTKEWKRKWKWRERYTLACLGTRRSDRFTSQIAEETVISRAYACRPN